MCCHLPERASDVMVPAAVRRGGSSEGWSREGITTKPSRRREVRWEVEGEGEGEIAAPFVWSIYTCIYGLWLLIYGILVQYLDISTDRSLKPCEGKSTSRSSSSLVTA